MAAVTIQELIAKRESISQKKRQLHVLNTSAGEIVCRPPTLNDVADADRIKDASESNAFLIYNCVTEPNLRDSDLLKAYGVVEPTEIVGKIFQAGEVARIAEALLEIAGFQNKIAHRILDEVKN